MAQKKYYPGGFRLTKETAGLAVKELGDGAGSGEGTGDAGRVFLYHDRQSGRTVRREALEEWKRGNEA